MAGQKPQAAQNELGELTRIMRDFGVDTRFVLILRGIFFREALRGAFCRATKSQREFDKFPNPLSVATFHFQNTVATSAKRPAIAGKSKVERRAELLLATQSVSAQVPADFAAASIVAI